MKKFIPYSEKFNRKHDFLVKYKLLIQEDYSSKIYQGMRSDFCYKEDEGKGQIYMIWPEFETKLGDVITDSTTEINQEGTARMYVMLEESRDEHKKRLKIGQKGFLVNGSHKLAEIEVIEIL